VLHDALTLDMTLNPDFSQVESDQPQVTVNQRFEVFFPEKRPFFLENAGFFQTPLNLFFSRRIAEPQFGIRLTGKVGRWAFGGLAADDRRVGGSLLETVPVDEPRAGIGVIRVQREFAEQSSVGMLVTSRDFASGSNRLFSLDTRLKLDPNWLFVAQVTRSESHDLDGARLLGSAKFAQLSHNGRHFTYEGRYTDISAGFRSEVGFIPRSDIRQVEQTLHYQWRPDRRLVVSFGPNLITTINWDHQGRLQDWLVNPWINIDMTGRTQLSVGRGESFVLFRGQGFRTGMNAFSLATEWLNWLTFYAFYEHGTNVNFFPDSGHEPYLTRADDGQINLALRPTSRMRFDQTYIFSRLRTRRGSTPPGVPDSTNIFNDHILRSKLNYQFNREVSLRVILDYNAVLSNVALVDLERSKRLTTDILLTYLVNPGTAVYVGYGESYENLAFDSTGPVGLHRISSPSTSTGQQLFIKISYLLRL
jgi:uncharacterized protein DUF5916